MPALYDENDPYVQLAWAVGEMAARERHNHGLMIKVTEAAHRAILAALELSKEKVDDNR